MIASSLYADDSASFQNSSSANALFNGYDSDDDIQNSVNLIVRDVGGDNLSTNFAQSITGNDVRSRISMEQSSFVSVGAEGGNELKKDADAGYFIVQNEQETKEGWLVVSDD